MRVVYARKEAIVDTSRGFPVKVPAGSHWPADDLVVKSAPWLFSDDPMIGINSSEPIAVEQATAAPGERRQVHRG